MQPPLISPRSSQVSSHAGAAFFCGLIASQSQPGPGKQIKVLVAGSGDGHEAVYIAQHLGAAVVAVDPTFSVVHRPEHFGSLSFAFASAESLPFKDSSFDAVLFHHVIEHVSDPQGCLGEIARVLTPEGMMFVGTPNRHRLVSAVGSSNNPHWDSNLRNKVIENVRDWRARLQGRFRNHLGAHAGYSRRELDGLLTLHFSRRVWLTKEYLLFKYAGSGLLPVTRLAVSGPQLELLAPSIYACCSKR